MRGKIEIICDDKGTHLSVNVSGTGIADKLFVVHALGKALELSPLDYMVLSTAETEGVLDGKGNPMTITIDTDELHKQLEEEQNEG